MKLINSLKLKVRKPIIQTKKKYWRRGETYRCKTSSCKRTNRRANNRSTIESYQGKFI